MLVCAEISLTIPYRVVNGHLDLVNLFPVRLDLKPFIDAWGNAATFKISVPDGSLHFCGVDVAPSAAGTIQTEDIYTTTGDPLYAAGFVEMQQGEAQIAPTDYLGNNNEPGVLAFEAVEAYGKPKLFGAENWRSLLSWRGRSRVIQSAVNCYSETEGSPAMADMNEWNLSKLCRQKLWVSQEFCKGTEFEMLPEVWGHAEGGRGFSWSAYPARTYRGCVCSRRGLVL